MHLGIDSTPAALICNELLIGSRPYQVLKDSIDRCLVTAENIEEEVGEHIAQNRDCAPFLEYHSCGYSSTSTTYQGRGGR